MEQFRDINFKILSFLQFLFCIWSKDANSKGETDMIKV